jgi:hypothetical protein
MNMIVKRFAPITKVADNDDGTITVFGVASTEAVDSQGEIITRAAMQDALPDFFKYGTGALRAMHQPIAAGTVTKATVNEAGETEIEAIVVDPVEITKVKTGTYKGFSVGGSKIMSKYDAANKTINGMNLSEISLVDRPSNPGAIITMFKADDLAPADATVVVTPEAVAAVDQLAEIVNKGDISIARLVELATAEISKGAPPFVKDDDEDDEDDTEKAVALGDVRKGMYSVSRFADLLCSLGYLASDSACEADWEGDASPMPAKLAAWVTAGAELFKEFTAEEVDELIASLKLPEVAVVVALSDAATDLSKRLTDASALGLSAYLTIAKGVMPENDAAALVLADGFEKATSVVISKLNPAGEALAKLDAANATIGKLEGELAVLKAMPADSRAVLRIVVEKGSDLATVAPVVVEGPILKADGTVDQDATVMAQIKKAHQSGGTPLRSFT